GQGAHARPPRLCGPPCPGLPQVVEQDPDRTQAGSPHLGAGSARHRRRTGRPAPLHLAARLPRRRRRAVAHHTPAAFDPPTAAMAQPPATATSPSHRPRSFGNEGGRMTEKPTKAAVSLPELARGRLLTVEEAAERLNTSPRFPRRLIEERRIMFVHIGRNVRIPEAALEAFIAAGVVHPITTTRGRVA